MSDFVNFFFEPYQSASLLNIILLSYFIFSHNSGSIINDLKKQFLIMPWYFFLIYSGYFFHILFGFRSLV